MQVFDSYIDAGAKLGDAEKKDFYCALIEYLRFGKEPSSLVGAADAVWTAIFPSLQISRTKAESGRKGGSKPKSKSESKTVSKDASESEAIKNTLTITTTNTTKEVVTYLNDKTGKSFSPSTKSTQKHVSARLKEGFTADDFKSVIDKKVSDWGNDPNMSKYLRPETLFGTKFESYLNEGRSNGQSVAGAFAGLW